MKLLSYLSPVFISILTVTTLYSANANRLEWSQVWIPLGMGLVIALFFMFIFWLNPLTNKKMPFIASVFTLATIMFYEIHPITAGVLMVGAIVFVWLIKSPEKHTQGGIMVSFIAIIGIIISGGQALLTVQSNNIQADNAPVTVTGTGKPNIYFIVPDRMPGIEGIKELGIDTDSFVADMRSMGFYVKENQMSHDPYTVDCTFNPDTTRTMRYFASVLNSGKEIPLDSTYKDTRNLIRQPSLFNDLHSQGYRITNIASWFAETKDILTADQTFKYDDIGILERIFDNELSVIYWNRTILRGINFRFLQSDASLGSVERGRAIWQSSMLKVMSDNPVNTGNQFVIAHILMPHEPFVFAANGSPADNRLSQPDQYKAQIEYALSYLLDIAGYITTNDPDAIIIIQSDEGMAYKKPVELNYALSPEQWNGVLTCWRIQNQNELELSSLKHTEILQHVINNLE